MRQPGTFTHKHSEGFTLPTVLIIGLALLVIGLSMFQTTSSVRQSIENEYYNRLAAEAAQSGITYGNYCFVSNDYHQTWGAAAGQPDLTQSTDCTGAPSTNATSTLLSTDTVQVTFSVGDTAGREDGATLVTSVGTVKRLRIGTSQVIATYTKTMKRVTHATDFKQSQAVFGYYYTCGDGAFFATLQSDGNYRAAGSNDFGQLGNGTITSTLTPTIYQLPAGETAARAFTNTLSQGCQLYVVTADGDLYGAGLNDEGQMGNNTVSAGVSTPVKASIPTGEKVIYVGVGGVSTYVLTDANKLYAMGSCSSGLLGGGTGSNRCTGSYKKVPTLVALPTPVVSNLNTIPAQEVVSDSETAYIRMQGGAVYGWGNNAYGQLANNSTTDTETPIKIGTFGDSGKPKAKQIAFDGDTIYIVADDGNAYAAGRNDYGQMGVNTTTSPYKTIQKVQVPLTTGEKVIRATTDQWFASFLTSKGNVYSVGYNSRGQLGNGSTATSVKYPVKFILPTGVTATYMYTTSLGTDEQKFNNTYVIGSDNRVYGAGSNTYGQIGIGTTATTVSTPKAMNVIDGSNIKAADVLAGIGTAVVISTTGIVYSVGNNDYGQLGDGTKNDSLVPIQAKYLQPRVPNYIF